MGSNWIDLKCSSQYVLTSLPPITKQSPTEGLVQAMDPRTAVSTNKSNVCNTKTSGQK